MQFVFDARALADFEGIFDWIAQDSPATAKIMLDRLFSSAELLTTFPFVGRVVRDAGALEWVMPRLPYVVVYEVDRENDRIVATAAVFHAAQDRGGRN
jgi:plasmid stabilization system protein ParE